MKKNLKLIISIVILIVVIAVASIIYNILSEKYAADNLTIEESDTDSEDDLDAAEDFTVVDADGNEVSLSSMIGTPIVLNFWASWCSPCKSEMSEFESAYAEYGDEVIFMMINVTDGSKETIESASEFIEEEGYTFPVYFDVDLDGVYTYDITGIPATYFIDSDGNIYAHSVGAIDEDTLIEGIESIIN